MDRRAFFGKTVSSGFAAGLATGAVAGAAGAVALVPRYVRQRPLPGKLSYAQQGEDLALWQIARNVLGIERPTYLDIGAHHPIDNNNTYYFYERGGRGVLVEPNPALHEAIEKARPRDRLLRAGIGVAAQKEADFYVIGGSPDGQLNTFSKEQAETLVGRSNGVYRIERVARLPLLNVNEVMRENFNGAPNVLSLDTEGFDLPILRSLDFSRLRPDVICVETVEIGGRRVLPEIPRLLAEKGYDARGGSFVNTIFVDRRHAA